MAVSYALTTVAKVKIYLSISVSTYDDFFEDLIDSLTDYIEKECGGRRFKDEGSDLTEIYDGDFDRIGKNKIFLRNYPVNAFTDVSHRSGDFDNPTWNVFDAGTEYVREDENGILHFLGSLNPGRQNIRVRYQAGFTSIPNDLDLLCQKIVAREFKRRRSQGSKNENLGGATISWNEDLPDDAVRMINSYKRYEF